MKNIQTGDKRKIKMMIDQGNLLGAGVGVSEAFVGKMNLGYFKIRTSNVRMAAKNKGMTKLGISKPFSIRLNGIEKEFKVQATVIKELVDVI